MNGAKAPANPASRMGAANASRNARMVTPRSGASQSSARWTPSGIYSATVTFLIVTGSTGTFWCMPWLPVRTAAILSTTSMPDVTLPNTA